VAIAALLARKYTVLFRVACKTLECVMLPIANLKTVPWRATRMILLEKVLRAAGIRHELFPFLGRELRRFMAMLGSRPSTV
jgi:hypothetical protein